MTYAEFKHKINTVKLPEREYYTGLINFYQDIIDDVSIHNQTIVAKELNISQAQLSSLLKVLKYVA